MKNECDKHDFDVYSEEHNWKGFTALKWCAECGTILEEYYNKNGDLIDSIITKPKSVTENVPN